MVSMSALFLATAFLAVGAFAETDLELAVESIIDGFRTIMPTGSERSGLPPLDPATIRQLSLNIKLSPFNAQCVASDIKISGTSAFEVTKLSQIDGSNKIAVDLELPNIDINGQYDLKGKVKIGFINVKLNGKGDLRAKLNGLKASATVDLLVGADGSLKVNQIALNSWSYKDLSIKLDKIAGGGVIGNTVNSLINSLAPTFIKSNKDKINALVVSKAKVLMNKYLASLYEKKLMHQPEGAAHSSPISLTIDEEAWNVSEETQEILDLLAAAAVGIPKLNAASLPEMVMQLLEDFRKMMPKGREDLGIPVLDPAVIPRMPVEVKLSPFDMSAVATDVHVAGVAAFIIHKLALVPNTKNQLAVEIEVPEVDVNGLYEINGKVSIGWMDVNLSGGKGAVTLKMKGFKGTATAEMIVNSDGSLNLNWLKFNTWKFDSVQAELENILMANFVNPLINKLIPLFLELNRGWINNWGESVSKTVVNRYLDGIAGKKTLLSNSFNDVAAPAIIVSPEAQKLLDHLALVLARRTRMM